MDSKEHHRLFSISFDQRWTDVKSLQASSLSEYSEENLLRRVWGKRLPIDDRVCHLHHMVMERTSTAKKAEQHPAKCILRLTVLMYHFSRGTWMPSHTSKYSCLPYSSSTALSINPAYPCDRVRTH